MSDLEQPFRCSGCGKPSLDGVKPCNCPTGVGFRDDPRGKSFEHLVFIEPEQAARNTLADLIKTRLLGVRPDDQDLQLEDDDWTRIVSALEGSARSLQRSAPDGRAE